MRSGRYVLRPASRHSELVHRLLRHVRSSGFAGVPEPVGIDPDGRERLVFIEGDVAVPSFPAWGQTDSALASVAELLARFHAAARGFEPGAHGEWSPELADPTGGPTICHNDVCLENVVFRNGRAFALLDFDFAAPGRALYDIAAMARMCVPLDLPEDAAVWGWGPVDPVNRLRLVADAYGLPPERSELAGVIEEGMNDRGFVRASPRRARGAGIRRDVGANGWPGPLRPSTSVVCPPPPTVHRRSWVTSPRPCRRSGSYEPNELQSILGGMAWLRLRSSECGVPGRQAGWWVRRRRPPAGSATAAPCRCPPCRRRAWPRCRPSRENG